MQRKVDYLNVPDERNDVPAPFFRKFCAKHKANIRPFKTPLINLAMRISRVSYLRKLLISRPRYKIKSDLNLYPI